MFLFFAFILGFLAAIPTGAVQIEVAKRSLNDHFGPALMVVLGAVLCNATYGFVAFLGIGPFLQNRTILAVFELGAVIILLTLAFFTLRRSDNARLGNIHRRLLGSRNLSFAAGFSLAATNPMMILWWLIGLKMARDLHLVDVLKPTVSILFICFGVCGIASYLTILAVVLHRVKRYISNRFMRRINVALAMALIALSLYFLMSAVKNLWS